MKNFIIYNEEGAILRTGTCQDSTFNRQAHEGEFVIEGMANDVTQKVVGGKVVDKTPAEIEADNPAPPVIPIENQPARITNKQWQNILDRLTAVEKDRS